jgi:X-Pro dipeptidyl-peptidase
VFVVHGVNDLNVQTSHFAKWWTALADNGVPRKLWLAQQGHVDPFDFRRAEWVETLHDWFDYWLQGLRNGVMREPQATLERSSGQWVEEHRWPAVGAHDVTVRLGDGDGTTGTLGFVPARRGTVRTFTDDPALYEDAAVADPNAAKNGRLAFLSGALTRDLRISGTPSVTLRVRVNKPTTGLAVRLVDYGTARRVDYLSEGSGVHDLTTESCWGASSATDDSCYLDTAEDFATRSHVVLTRGWVDAAHHATLREARPLQPNRWYDIRVPVQAYDAVVPKGHVLGLVVTASDDEFSTPKTTGATIDVDLRGSSIRLPAASFVGLPPVTTPPTVPTDATVSARTTGQDWRNPEFR